MRWRWGVLAVAWAACLGACALVSGLSSLDVGVVDASVAKDVAAEAAPEASAADGSADVVLTVDGDDPSVLHCGPDASCKFGQQACCVKSSTYQCVDKNGCSGDGAAVLVCNYGAQCTNGGICCLQAGGNLASPTIACRSASECKGASFNYQLCRTSAECLDGGVCTTVPTATWLSYCN